jgi:hypothetical protein
VETLEISMQDLGRLAAFLEGNPAAPLDAVIDFVKLYSVTSKEVTEETIKKVREGYDETDWRILDGVSTHDTRSNTRPP